MIPTDRRRTYETQVLDTSVQGEDAMHRAMPLTVISAFVSSEHQSGARTMPASEDGSSPAETFTLSASRSIMCACILDSCRNATA
jgi:hypothetical protein